MAEEEQQEEWCTGCTEGLLHVAEVIVRGTDEEYKKLRLCPQCKETLIKSLLKDCM